MDKPHLCGQKALSCRMKNSAWTSLTYMNPEELLLRTDKILDDSGIKKYKNFSDILLNRRTRNMLEDRRCATFCHGLGQILDKKILFANYESADHDYIGAYKNNGELHTFPIQLKQLVPDRLNPSTSLQNEISKLKKYTDAQDLVVAIHVNRGVHIKPNELDFSEVTAKEVWIFGQLKNDVKTWLLFGNLMTCKPNSYTFQLPTT